MFRKLPDGRLIIPNKKPYPPAPKGYCQDDKNPLVYHPILKDCEHRFDKSETLPCGATERIIECGYYDKEVSIVKCHECGGKPKIKPKKKLKEKSHI